MLVLPGFLAKDGVTFASRSFQSPGVLKSIQMVKYENIGKLRKVIGSYTTLAHRKVRQINFCDESQGTPIN